MYSLDANSALFLFNMHSLLSDTTFHPDKYSSHLLFLQPVEAIERRKTTAIENPTFPTSSSSFPPSSQAHIHSQPTPTTPPSSLRHHEPRKQPLLT